MSNVWDDRSVCGPTCAVIEQLIDENRRWTLLEKCTVQILRNVLHLRKIAEVGTPCTDGSAKNSEPHSTTGTSWCDRYDVEARDKRLDLADSAIILQDNARPHKAECVRQLLRRWGWEELEHPPYSLDISSCDFDLIPKIKKPIRGRWFAT
ncbi:uncharacterized protein TNCV_2612361 [Trichonephila clavipes]|nr:uncharacterized protein TNCV_2612361 [Trichonephila clavipes]